jgi:hypothetical protein
MRVFAEVSYRRWVHCEYAGRTRGTLSIGTFGRLKGNEEGRGWGSSNVSGNEEDGELALLVGSPREISGTVRS